MGWIKNIVWRMNMQMQWNLRIADTLGTAMMSVVEVLPISEVMVETTPLNK